MYFAPNFSVFLETVVRLLCGAVEPGTVADSNPASQRMSEGRQALGRAVTAFGPRTLASFLGESRVQ
jgi:hypothetical protein